MHRFLRKLVLHRWSSMLGFSRLLRFLIRSSTERRDDIQTGTSKLKHRLIALRQGVIHKLASYRL